MTKNRYVFQVLSFVVIMGMVGGGMVWYASTKEASSVNEELGELGPVVVVYTPSAPFADIIKNVGGSRVAVRFVASVDEYREKEQTNPTQRGVWFVLGGGLDAWVNDAAYENHPVISFIHDADIVNEQYPIEIGKIDQNAPRDYLLSLENGKRLALAVARELGTIDTIQKNMYINNAYAYSLSLSKYGNTIQTELRSLRDMRVITQDRRYDDFLAFVGVKVVGGMNLEGNREEALEDLVYNVRYFGVDAVVVDSGSATQDIFEVLKKTSTNVVIIDGIGEKVGDYLSFVRGAISALVRGK